MPYDLIQGQGHRGLKVAKMVNFKVWLLSRYACSQKILKHNVYILTGQIFWYSSLRGVDQSHMGLFLTWYVCNIWQWYCDNGLITLVFYFIYFLQHSPCSQHASMSSPLLTSCSTTPLFTSLATPPGVCSTTRMRLNILTFITVKTAAVPMGQFIAVRWRLWQTTTTTKEKSWVEHQIQLHFHVCVSPWWWDCVLVEVRLALTFDIVQQCCYFVHKSSSDTCCEVLLHSCLYRHVASFLASAHQYSCGEYN